MAIMIKTQVQIPDALFERAKRVAAAKEWSFAEIVRRGLEQMTLRHPAGIEPGGGEWQLPGAVEQGLREDPLPTLTGERRPISGSERPV